MTLPILFDAVLFDLDGTLIATDRFWVQAARTGARRAFDELGLEREIPGSEEWMQLVGLPLEDGFRTLFADLPEELWRAVMRACTEEEERLLAAGGAALMPGADELLTELRAAGKHLGIASNCSRSYLDHMLLGQRLGERTDSAYCLDSGGIGDKADMIQELLGDFDTRSAVFVGDRRGDRDAAWANGLPHVHCEFGFRPPGEEVQAEGTIEDLGELTALLRQRAAWIAAALHELDVEDAPCAVGVTGAPAAGKTLFARDAARLLTAAGVEAAHVSLDPHRRPSLAEPFDAPGLSAELERLPRDRPVFVDGSGLLEDDLRGRFDRVVHLEIPEDLSWRRLSGREARLGGPEALDAAREVFVPGYRDGRSRQDPGALADLVLDASNALGVDVEKRAGASAAGA